MKRIYTVVSVIILGLASSLTAQAQGGLRWGVMGGANFSKFSTKADDYKSDLFTAFHIGPMVEYELPIFPLALEAGVLYAQKGANFDMAGKDALSLKSNLIEIPVNVKGYVFSIPAARFFILAGPSFNYAFNTIIGDIKLENSNDIKANKLGIGLNAGIGVEVLKYLQISATFNAAMSDSYKFEGAAKVFNDYINTKEKGFSVTARVLF
ncbi:porin family protein [uncultured Porphyromonas sp.]|uniref:porin family protein n=1 Tax=uncultured Porphyromonas sp. TaxID=159274 RepID=UPI0025864D3E|nr:porin family protein [uncultured Porphyromonas sp.]